MRHVSGAIKAPSLNMWMQNCIACDACVLSRMWHPNRDVETDKKSHFGRRITCTYWSLDADYTCIRLTECVSWLFFFGNEYTWAARRIRCQCENENSRWRIFELTQFVCEFTYFGSHLLQPILIHSLSEFSIGWNGIRDFFFAFFCLMFP